jgi:putative ABC transport system permease protein
MSRVLMRRVLLTKARRDIRRQLAQFVSVAVIVALGAALFVASWDAFRNLSNSYEHTYQRLHFADLVAEGGETGQVAAAAAGDEVAAVSTRTQVDLPMQIGDTKLLGRVVGLPADGAPAVGQVEVETGDYLDPDEPEGVLIESHAADTFGLVPGDTLRVFGAGGWQEVRVSGVVVSPEYLWAARSRQDLLPDPHSFAVVFAAQPTALALAGATGPNQVLVELTEAARAGGGAGPVADALRDAGAADVRPRADQPSNAALHEDLSAFAELAVAFPVLFLTAAAVAGYVLITRRVLAERPIIGTLLAAGARRGAIVRHYLTHGVVAGLVGAAVGVGLGLVATAWLTRAYTSAFDIPDTVVARSPATMATGLAFGLLVGALGGLAPARAVARTSPAEAMRNQIGTARPGRWSRGVARARFLPVSWRMALRDIGRSRRRTVATMLGTVLALVLVLAATGMILSMQRAVDVQFGQVQREDATVLADPAAADTVRAALAATDGVSAVEPAIQDPVTAAAGDRTYSTVLFGLSRDTVMHGFRGTGASAAPELPAGGVLAGAALAGELDVAVGDELVLTAAGAPERTVRLAGLLDEPLGTYLYATREVAGAVVGRDTGPAPFLVRFADDADREQLRETITGLPGVVAYTDAQALAATVDDFLGLFWAFVGSMAVLGGILAFTVIYVTMTVNLAERTTELATLRAAGVRVRRIAAVVANENLVATALAVPLGLAAGALVSWLFLESFNSDLFSFELALSWPTLALAAAGVVLAAMLSQLPAVLAIRRLDVARVVRERAQ